MIMHAQAYDCPLSVDIVVVNYQTPRDLSSFLQSVADSLPYDNDNLIASLTVVNVDPDIADVEAGEKGIDRINALRPGLARQMHFSWNVGYACACNAGAGLGSAGVVAFFNADTRIAPDTIHRCSEILTSHSRVAICGPRQVDDSGAITHAGIFGTNEKPRLRGWKSRTDDFLEDRTDAVSVSGSAYFVKRSIWEDLTKCPTYQEFLSQAGFDDPFTHERAGAFLPTRHYYEETFASYHARAHGWKIAYVGSATMTHKWHQASPVGGPADRLMPESRKLFRDACDFHGIAHD